MKNVRLRGEKYDWEVRTTEGRKVRLRGKKYG